MEFNIIVVLICIVLVNFIYMVIYSNKIDSIRAETRKIQFEIIEEMQNQISMITECLDNLERRLEEKGL